jgi:hypothetical protein
LSRHGESPLSEVVASYSVRPRGWSGVVFDNRGDGALYVPGSRC